MKPEDFARFAESVVEGSADKEQVRQQGAAIVGELLRLIRSDAVDDLSRTALAKAAFMLGAFCTRFVDDPTWTAQFLAMSSLYIQMMKPDADLC